MPKKIAITVVFSAEVPDGVSYDDIDAITIQVPYEQIRIDACGGKVTDHITTFVEEDE